MLHRVARSSLLGLYLAASLLGGALPHADDCSAHAHEVSHGESGSGLLASADADHGADCATCKFLGQRCLNPSADPLPTVERAVAGLLLTQPCCDLQWPRSPHDPRGPPRV